METLFKILVGLHVLAGFTSLCLFWVPVFSRKGGRYHRLAGRWYINFMWVVTLTAFLLSVKNLWQGNLLIGVFLGFLSIITAKPLWLGIAILRNQHQQSRAFYVNSLLINSLVAVAGIALILYGLSLADQSTAIFMYVFGGIGASSIFDLVSILRNGPRSKQHLRLHVVSMGTSGIAAHTAFLAFGANRYFIEWLIGYWVLVPWLAPTLIGGVVIHLATRKLTMTNNTQAN